MTFEEVLDVAQHILLQWGRRIGAVLLIGIALPIYLLGAGIAGLAVGTGKGVEAWWVDVKRYWRELKL